MKLAYRIIYRCLLIIPVISLIMSFHANAACNYRSSSITGIDYNCHTLLYGIAGRNYYIDSSAANVASRVTSAISNWNSTSSDLSFSKVTAPGTAVVKFQAGTVAEANSPGQTIMYSSTSTYNPASSSWPNAKIILSSNLYNSNALTLSQWQGTSAHEFGHAIGLNHMLRLIGANPQRDPYWIMTPFANRLTNTVDSDAADVIDHHLY